MNDINSNYQQCCLYFTANSLTRHINEMADGAFRTTGLSPSYAHLLLLVIDNPGLTQNELSGRMNLKPSTLTRFFDKLVKKDLVERLQKGREVNIYATNKGKESKILIDKALNQLYKNYCDVLGEEFAVKLTAGIYKATCAFE
ncbi:MarR family winged helix-turn-helix transcriptional regulator [Carboxylicivirga sp. RSCT41]|uniref:MarR family winged helix-turn-helix transcriptional regulator n=1 Tax=Carboxylicivirga agarovorans TaxID=3417570 RepID=UPI003D350DD8